MSVTDLIAELQSVVEQFGGDNDAIMMDAKGGIHPIMSVSCSTKGVAVLHQRRLANE